MLTLVFDGIANAFQSFPQLFLPPKASNRASHFRPKIHPKSALPLQRCRKMQKSRSHAGREALFFVLLTERGKPSSAICDTSRTRARFKNDTLAWEVVQKSKIAFPRWARTPKKLRSHPARERNFAFLQHRPSESVVFTRQKGGRPRGDLLPGFKFL